MDNALRGELYIEIPAKIADLEEAGLRYQYISRLQVPVHDTEPVHVLHSRYDLLEEFANELLIQIKFCD